MAKILTVEPVLPSTDIERDVKWYEKYTGFQNIFDQDGYAVLKRDTQFIHLQYHTGGPEDPVNQGSVVKLFVDDIQSFYEEMVGRGTINESKLRMNTPWKTHEFGFYDLNKNAIFFVQDI